MYKVLIIEDERAYRDLLKEKFLEAGFEAYTATDGKQGVIEAAKNPPEFILLDLMMPVMDGMAMLAELRKYEKNLPAGPQAGQSYYVNQS